MKIRLVRKWWLPIALTAGLLAAVWMVGTALAQEPAGSNSLLAPAGGSAANAVIYQGRLLEDGEPVSGTYDFLVTIWDSNVPTAIQVASCLTTGTEGIPVENGVINI